jgi:hypothetical protein
MRWFSWLLIAGMVGHSLACTHPRLLYRPLKVAYLPYFVKGLPDHLPSHKILVLLPLDQRQSLAVRKGTIPPVVRGANIVWERQPVPAGAVVADAFYPVIGFRGTSSRGSLFIQSPSRFFPPDLPSLFFYTGNLEETVQQALAAHLSEARLQAIPVPFSDFHSRQSDDEIQADYALGCTIEEFVLLSLLYYVQGWRPEFFPVLGPTWARVNLVLTLYRWPCGEQLWEGRVSEALSDPVPGDRTHIYGSMGEVMSVALSRAVGSLLVTQAVQDILARLD